MPNKMLIDATHPEETRVVVVRGTRVEEFDFESATKKQLRGNIYLAKVTRVEPSLQAAFVEYGGNRHGFLAFSEIHPDYYQIPVADRQALIEAEEREEQEENERRSKSRRERERERERAPAAAAVTEIDEGSVTEIHSNGNGNGDDDEDHVESVGAEDALEEVPERRKPRMRQYKIQEVIKRRQVLLVQVVKEERGTKGAALTTYLSLAGRYSVLMPNSGRGGGISRKITNITDRKRLKEIAHDLEVPEGMGVILRTAGAARTKAEIKRDFEYLLRLWENVRELTLQSSAPTLVYEEGSLVKRSIRDLYNKDIDEVLVSGDEAYREAKDFMRMLMPSHAKNVQPYRDVVPIFARFSVEPQLDAMFSPQVTLRSGGYIVINQTEALVSIDVNSGRSTREHNIEDTALATNMEAAEEVARQLRLRDLAGLIVIDFIDMEESKNNKSVERKLKECLKNDRARIQVGRISHFGLMEMSRQRIRTGVLEGSTEVCTHCLGAGIVRSTESVALHVLRALEDQLLKGVTHHLTVRTRTGVALYILNQKRKHLADLESRFGLVLTISADEHLGNQHFALERGELILNPLPPPTPSTLTPESVQPFDEDDLAVEELEEEEEGEEETTETRARNGEPRRESEGDGQNRRRRRRRRRRRGGPGDTPGEGAQAGSAGDEFEDGDESEGDGEAVAAEGASEEGRADEVSAETSESDEAAEAKRRSRRRGRRGGRRRNGKDGEMIAGDEEASDVEASGEEATVAASDEEAAPSVDTAAALPAFASQPVEFVAEEAARAESVDDDTAADEDEPAAEVEVDEPAVEENHAEPAAAAEPAPAPEPAAAPARKPTPARVEVEDDDRPKRSGWWQRRSFF
ncbi:ribonuclease E/G [Chthonobacter albigriseus]|uniref:ribonuclease E/G n=1 Tax=Chthonobacter albigriseus TaxID=1683161 RepID=UPI0015EEAB64|nr:ribonuclease E/G [Chthonobacter albigriseus]